MTGDEPSDQRVPVTIRLSGQGIKAIDQIAETEDRSRSSIIRVLLAEAIAARQETPRRWGASQ